MRKKALVTAGATVSKIDEVRVISNIFNGKTGTAIAAFLSEQRFDATLITSNPSIAPSGLRVISYKTYNQLFYIMEEEILAGQYDLIIHSAAVSDYEVEQVFGVPNGCSVQDVHSWIEIDRTQTGKIPSSRFKKLIIVASLTEKIIDKIRNPWGFHGPLVKFKLEVGISDQELIEIAKKSRLDSDAQIIVANCLAWSKQYAYVIGEDNTPKRVSREEIATELYHRIYAKDKNR